TYGTSPTTVLVRSNARHVSNFSAAIYLDERLGIGAEETAPAETVMDAFYQKPEPSGRRWRVQATTSRRSSARSFLAAISRRPTAGGGAIPRQRRPHRRAAPGLARRGCRHTYRPRRADIAGCSFDNRFTHHSRPMSEHPPPQEAHWPEVVIFTLGYST